MTVTTIWWKKMHAHQGIATNEIIHYILVYTQATNTSANHNAYIPTHNLKIQSFRGHSRRTQECNNSSAWVIELLHFCANPSFCLPGVRVGVHVYNKLPACKYHTPPVETGRIMITLIAIKKAISNKPNSWWWKVDPTIISLSVTCRVYLISCMSSSCENAMLNCTIQSAQKLWDPLRLSIISLRWSDQWRVSRSYLFSFMIYDGKAHYIFAF